MKVFRLLGRYRRGIWLHSDTSKPRGSYSENPTGNPNLLELPNAPVPVPVANIQFGGCVFALQIAVSFTFRLLLFILSYKSQVSKQEEIVMSTKRRNSSAFLRRRTALMGREDVTPKHFLLFKLAQRIQCIH